MTRCLPGPIMKAAPISGGNPFGDFFVGLGTIGGVGFADAIPHPDYQSGDILYVLNGSSLLGWSLVHSVPAANFAMFVRVATGTSADNIPSSSGGFIRQIVATRNNASFSKSGSGVMNSYGTGGLNTIPVPANNFNIVLGDASFIMYAGIKTGMTSAVDILPGDVDMEITGTRILSSIISFVGIGFQAANANIPQANTAYSVVEVGTPFTNTFRQQINIL